MSGPVDVLGILRRTSAGLHSVAGDCKTDLGTPMRQAAEDVDAARVTVAELIEAAKEYRKQYGWQGSPWQERAAIKLDDALANIGSAS